MCEYRPICSLKSIGSLCSLPTYGAFGGCVFFFSFGVCVCFSGGAAHKYIGIFHSSSLKFQNASCLRFRTHRGARSDPHRTDPLSEYIGFGAGERPCKVLRPNPTQPAHV